ncbi:serine/threonine-protein kinase [Streptomyces sp. NPDC050560]|uniref:serine/threonine-protein kinase n=1 Tax=Streptomyces sp. NPDC050560 TaxID=3365630 RepID=UPI0037B3336D
MSSDDTLPEEPGPERLTAGRYRLLARLGEGGMGTVWRAYDQTLRREVAVKEVRTPAGYSEAQAERMYTRMEREVWAAARVTHRNVITVYDVVTDEGRPWIVMELVRGRSLADLAAGSGTLAPERAAEIGAEVLAALRAADAAGVLHRDVKPANVLIADDGRVVLTDFGIAVIEGDSALTMTGQVVGSPEYVAPERALGRPFGLPSDLWSLGVMLYVLVEGGSPFRRDTPLGTLRAVVDDEAPAPRGAGALTPVIESLLHKDPARRPEPARLEHDLRRVATGATPPAPGATVTPPAPAVVTPPQDPRTIQATPPAPTGSSPTEPSPTPPSPVPPAPTPPGFGAPPPGFGTPGYPVAPAADPAAPAAPGRRRRTVFVAVGAALAVVALAVTSYTLLRGDDGDGGRKTAGPEATSPASPAASGGSTPVVRVAVTGVRTSYTGPCPPADGDAPAFTATFTVTRLPAQFSYRWVSVDGRVTDPRWRTVSFPEGEGLTRQETVSLNSYADEGTFESRLAVELKSPVKGKSNAVPLTMTCG